MKLNLIIKHYTSSLKKLYSTKFNSPSPIPLPAKEQQEFLKLIKETQAKELAEQGQKHPDALYKHEEFVGDKNPQTGEIGGPKGKEPTRYGDWERNGRVFDF